MAENGVSGERFWQIFKIVSKIRQSSLFSLSMGYVMHVFTHVFGKPCFFADFWRNKLLNINGFCKLLNEQNLDVNWPVCRKKRLKLILVPSIQVCNKLKSRKVNKLQPLQTINRLKYTWILKPSIYLCISLTNY